jgi:putative membrane protein
VSSGVFPARARRGNLRRNFAAIRAKIAARAASRAIHRKSAVTGWFEPAVRPRTPLRSLASATSLLRFHPRVVSGQACEVSMIKPFVNWLIVGGIAVAFVNCGGDQKEPETAPPSMEAPEPEMTPASRATPPPVSEPAPQEAAPDTWAGSTPEGTPPPPPIEKLSDEQVAAVMDAANESEIAQAKIAQKNAKNAKVKKFAAMMITDHTQAKQKQKKLLTKANVTPSDNMLSTQLKTESEQKVEDLKALKGADFDRAYMDAQVDAHRKVLEALDGQLIPSVQDAEYKAMLSEVRGKVASHLEQAKEIQQALLDSGASSAPIGSESSSSKGSMPNEPGTGSMPNDSAKPAPSDMAPHQH